MKTHTTFVLAPLFALLVTSCHHDVPTAPGSAQRAEATTTTLPPVKPTPSLEPAMAKLGFMRGVWKGIAEGTTPEGKRY